MQVFIVSGFLVSGKHCHILLHDYCHVAYFYSWCKQDPHFLLIKRNGQPTFTWSKIWNNCITEGKKRNYFIQRDTFMQHIVAYPTKLGTPSNVEIYRSHYIGFQHNTRLYSLNTAKYRSNKIKTLPLLLVCLLWIQRSQHMRLSLLHRCHAQNWEERSSRKSSAKP